MCSWRSFNHTHCFLQLCNGVDENAVGTSAELIFAPIDASFSDDAPIIPCGFRIIPLDSKTVMNISLGEMLSFAFIPALKFCVIGKERSVAFHESLKNAICFLNRFDALQ